jgi:carbonic anhydrase
MMKVEESFDFQYRKLSSMRSGAALSLEEEHAQEYRSTKEKNATKSDSFDEIKQRFLSFKKHKYLEEWERFQYLAKAQSPKFMVIACADSRVCPSNILGFQPGEAFMTRNVANLVPPNEEGACETNAALEFAVNTLEVENILVVGHSCCAGIERLMEMQDYDSSSSFADKWVEKGKIAKLTTKTNAAHLSFDQQCRYCEKESINQSLQNLVMYPWIKDRVRKELLHIHGGYYDFLNCTFEKWSFDYERSRESTYAVKDTAFWC